MQCYIGFRPTATDLIPDIQKTGKKHHLVNKEQCKTSFPRLLSLQSDRKDKQKAVRTSKRGVVRKGFLEQATMHVSLIRIS